MPWLPTVDEATTGAPPSPYGRYVPRSPTGAADRALDACPEECWVCEEHDGEVEYFCYAAEIPHREHLCLECRHLLAAPPEREPHATAKGQDSEGVPLGKAIAQHVEVSR